MSMLQNLGIDLPFLGGFILANIVGYFGDDLIQWLYNKRFDDITRQNPDKTLSEARAKSEEWRSKLDLDFGKRIGRMERIFYIYAIMLTQFSLLSGWLIMKAFYGWIQKPGVSHSSATEEDKEITTFYAYIYGNGLSLLMALALAHLGIVISKALHIWVFTP